MGNLDISPTVVTIVDTRVLGNAGSGTNMCAYGLQPRMAADGCGWLRITEVDGRDIQIN